MRLGFVEYALPPRPDDLLAHLTDAYSWHFLRKPARDGYAPGDRRTT
jgi:hypothetical protein